ncbi:MAG: hypothetical protein WCT16_01415 [Candidatus Buchananbacteria bacterium]
MPPQADRKMPLMAGQYLWIASKKDGQLRMLIGPDPLDVSEDDIFLIPDQNNPTKWTPVDQASSAIQEFVTINHDEYAVIYNPVDSADVDKPNGGYQKGKNEMKVLKRGSKRTVTSGYFPVWPGQRVEVRKVHTLSASQYLVAVVENPNVDEQAPYYSLTIQSAGLKKAVFETAEDKPEDSGAGQNGAGSTEESQKQISPEAAKNTELPQLIVGQRIVIRGSETPTYIPPTGIDVVRNNPRPQTATNIEPNKSAEQTLQEKMESGDIRPDQVTRTISELGWRSHYQNIRDTYQELKNRNASPRNFYAELIQVLNKEEMLTLVTKLCNVEQNDFCPTAPAERDTAVCEALVPGPTEFCVIIDKEGNPDTRPGPGRAFPGPYDRFRTTESRNGIYDAYHIRPDRGILIRTTATSISKAELAAMLPSDCILEKEIYLKGDEIFVGGMDAYVVPTRAFQVIHPVTRQPHTGNDHSEVYVLSIGVDQKSGIYVANVETGNVELIRGEKKVLPDPRKQRHIKRRIPGWLWNLVIGEGEPHKKVDPRQMVETPWAMSVPVPNNTAILVTGKNSRRVVVGPKTELFEFEEVPEVLKLSTGRPKNDEKSLETCFLRIRGNRVTDAIELVTEDFVSVNVEVCYGVEFVSDNEEERLKWFNHQDYVLFFCEHLRSRLRAAARQVTLDDLYKDVAEFVRDTVLGKKPEGEGQHRPGMTFKENNMKVLEVEVLAINIPDKEVAAKLLKINTSIVSQQLDDMAASVALQSKRKQAQIAGEEANLSTEKTRLEAEQKLKLAKIADEAAVEQNEIDKARAQREAAKKLEIAKINEEAARQQAEIDKAKEEREAEQKLELAKIADKAAEQQVEISKIEIKRNLMLALERAAAKLQQDNELARVEHESKLALIMNEQARRKAKQDGDNDVAKLELEQANAKALAELNRIKAENASLVEFRKALAEIDSLITKETANADKTRLEAIQPKLVEALQALGDKQLATALAEHLPEAGGSLGLLTGLGGIEAVKKLVKGTRLENIMDALSPRKPGEGEVPTPQK